MLYELYHWQMSVVQITGTHRIESILVWTQMVPSIRGPMF